MDRLRSPARILWSMVSTKATLGPVESSMALRVLAPAFRRTFSATAESATKMERPEEKMTSLLKEKLNSEFVEVKDVSGGCGSFYTVMVVSEKFVGMPMVKQHRSVAASGETFCSATSPVSA